jgi:hypothetical protein
MADYTNPQETERTWLEALEREMQSFQSSVERTFQQSWAVGPQQIWAIMDHAQRVLQWLAQYTPVAVELSRRGYPKLQERLDFVRKDLGEAHQIYGEMYGTAVQHQAYRQQIQRGALDYSTRCIQESTMHSQKVFDQCNQMQSYVNHGMSFGWAEFLAKMPK